jgi:3-hydroxyacyl-[acyl-carrier-protein] dehydratase
MRWMWIDRIIELEPGKRLVAIKNVSLAEEHLHDHFPAQAGPDGEPLEPLPVMPACFLIEGMAQTAGILVGHAGGFKEKVILAKVPRAELTGDVFPGMTVRYEATLERLDRAGASTVGVVSVRDHTPDWRQIGAIEIFFSHVDQNLAGVEFPEENFVFGDNFKALLAASNIPELTAAAAGN